MYNGMPPPSCGIVFVSVWYDGQRGKGPDPGRWAYCLDQMFGLYVTITLRAGPPFDLWIRHRIAMEKLANRITTLIHRDSQDYSITRAAQVLAGYRMSGKETSPAKPVGWVNGLGYEGWDAVQDVPAGWLHAKTESPEQVPQGISQRLRFGQSRRIQHTDTAQ